MKLHSALSYLSFQNIILMLLLALLPSFFLHHRVNGFIIMLIIIVGIVQYFWHLKSSQKLGFIVLIPFLFLILIVGQLYTDDLKTGWTLVERSLSLLLVPFALSRTTNFSHSQKKLVINFFVICGLISSLYCLGFQSYLAWQSGSIYASEVSNHFLFNIFMHHRLSAPIGMHAVYFSLFIAFMAIYVLNQAVNGSGDLSKRLRLIALFLFFVIMIYLLKSAIIVTGFSIVVLLIVIRKSITTNNLKAKYLLIGGAIVIFVFTIVAIKAKMEFINLDYQMSDPNMGMLAIRLSIWENAWSVISQNWLLGVGTGDGDLSLLNAYKTSNFIIGYTNDYNCHNMYLQYWLGNGIFAVGLFMTFLMLLLRKALENKNVVFIGFIILFALFSFTESTMRVQKGMVFFMVISSLFYWNPTLWSIKGNAKT